jgi:hypothetical protein
MTIVYIRVKSEWTSEFFLSEWYLSPDFVQMDWSPIFYGSFIVGRLG